MLRRRAAFRFCAKSPSPESLAKLLRLIKTNPNLTMSSEKIESIMPEIDFPREPKTLPYLKSLFYERKSVYDTDLRDLEQNATAYTEEIFKPQLSLRGMTEEQKQRVNLLADMKLQEVEDSGLSRSELAGFESKTTRPRV